MNMGAEGTLAELLLIASRCAFCVCSSLSGCVLASTQHTLIVSEYVSPKTVPNVHVAFKIFSFGCLFD